MLGLPTGLTLFLIETSYMEPSCANISIRPRLEGVSDLASFDSSTFIYASSNGTFRGANTTQATEPTWPIGLDVFISLSWLNLSDISQLGHLRYFPYPLFLQNLADTQASTGTLFFQNVGLLFVQGPWTFSDENSVAFCEMEQVYVESQVPCNQGPNSTRNCSVVAQRPPQRSHAPPQSPLYHSLKSSTSYRADSPGHSESAPMVGAQTLQSFTLTTLRQT